MLDINKMTLDAMKSNKNFYIELGHGVKIKAGVSPDGYVLILQNHEKNTISSLTIGVSDAKSLNQLLERTFGVELEADLMRILGMVNQGFSGLSASTLIVKAGVLPRNLHEDYVERWEKHSQE